uniref:(northern house mosquito) hypothetical protein n=1 Tax=Culex pipiens TaxID=7175 RepID=A0A8D8IP91_CULPI
MFLRKPSHRAGSREGSRLGRTQQAERKRGGLCTNGPEGRNNRCEQCRREAKPTDNARLLAAGQRVHLGRRRRPTTAGRNQTASIPTEGTSQREARCPQSVPATRHTRVRRGRGRCSSRAQRDQIAPPSFG